MYKDRKSSCVLSELVNGATSQVDAATNEENSEPRDSGNITIKKCGG